MLQHHVYLHLVTVTVMEELDGLFGPGELALSGGPATLGPVFPSLLQTASTPRVSYPDLYPARCEQSDGASWLNVSKATGPADHRPTVTEDLGPAYGYHARDLGLAQDNLVSDVAAAEITWTHR
jgi:hypothetical protein